MLKEMTLTESCDTIHLFAQANQVDLLRAIELMVNHYKQLSTKEQAALHSFMSKTKQKTQVDE